MRAVAALSAASLLAWLLLLAPAGTAHADVPDPAVAATFTAPTCDGATDFDPTDNVGFAVADTTLVFAERLNSYNAGHIVPLYDSYGGSVLLLADGSLNANGAAYPPVCGTRYVESAGGPVSEWMFCTDREAQSCGDTDMAGNLVDEDGQPINPMVGVPVNPKLTSSQERLIAHLIVHGHSYAGLGDQAWGGATEARSDIGTAERNALQTLIWCISDPPSSASDFQDTCDDNLPPAEQARLLSMIPEVPELVLDFAPSGTVTEVGDTARFALTTNVFNQPIALVAGGAATTGWTVCSGDAVLSGSTLTVAGSDPTTPVDVTLCAEATERGTATLSATTAPASTQHIGWSQSVNPGLTNPCQVYATFHTVNKSAVTADALATFAVPGSTADTMPPTGGLSLWPLWLGIGLVTLGGIALVLARRRGSPRA